MDTKSYRAYCYKVAERLESVSAINAKDFKFDVRYDELLDQVIVRTCMDLWSKKELERPDLYSKSELPYESNNYRFEINSYAETKTNKTVKITNITSGLDTNEF